MQVFITGVSRGLGKALAEHFLSKGSEVVGIGRSHSIKNQNFHFIQCDLEDPASIEQLNFSEFKEDVILINNAGIIGSIERISDQQQSDIAPVLTVNIISPMLLCQKFLQAVPKESLLKILNISSGAASRPIPSWASYCASKAALEIFSETIYLEEKEKGRDVRVFAISPGVIDTSMQEKIRISDEKSFSNVHAFRELKQNGQLQSPEETAIKIAKLIELPYSGKVIYSLRDY